MSEVALHIYDLSMGMARTMAGALIGFDVCTFLPSFVQVLCLFCLQ